MNELTNFTNLGMIEYSAAIIVLNIVLSFILSIIIAVVYQKTHRGVSYSQSFVVSLVMMCVLSAVAMMILGNNLIRALGILGVFTLLRFRTIIKDTKDATYLFFSLAMGMAVGTSNYIIAFLATILLSSINIFLFKINFGSVIREGYILTVTTNSDIQDNFYKKSFDQYVKFYKLLQIRTSSGEEKEFYFSLKFKDESLREEFVSAIKNIQGVDIVDLITSRDSAEY